MILSVALTSKGASLKESFLPCFRDGALDSSHEAINSDVAGNNNVVLYYNSVNNDISNSIKLKSLNNNFFSGNPLMFRCL